MLLRYQISGPIKNSYIYVDQGCHLLNPGIWTELPARMSDIMFGINENLRFDK